MKFKAYFFKKYGILLKESESTYLNYLYEKYNDYNKVLNEFSLNCTTRYFNNKNINEIKSDIIKEEIGRSKHNKGGDVSNSDYGNLTNNDILAKQGIFVDNTANTISGQEELYIELDGDQEEKEEGLTVPVEADYGHIVTRNLKNKLINNKK